MRDMSETIVSLRHIVKHYARGKQDVPVLDNLNLDIAAGEFLALMGPSGSGKTTLLNLIGGLDRPPEGEVAVGGGHNDEPSRGGVGERARPPRRLRLPVLQPDADPLGRKECRAAAAADPPERRPAPPE